MSNLAIKAENISKQYRLGQVGTGTLTHDLNRFWHKIRGNEDPYLKIGEANDRSSKGSSDYVWSLQDINFEIEQGDAVGIIGRNGAGKSTLLKILSKVTKPTTGKIYTKGRIASLLEVGTGFHPEMTGRENIYLNGAILGMTKKEITRKFDEIVDFSGVERYIDTPVKRYSSGMYVRLAFAVAAHLESEILIVDEVLAVGDAEFQKKCLGKMGDVTKGEGRTILFVSHNMVALKSLCNKSIMLENGKLLAQGNTLDIIDNYYLKGKESSNLESYEAENLEKAIGNEFIKLLKANVVTQSKGPIKTSTEFKLEFEFYALSDLENINLNLTFHSTTEHIFTVLTPQKNISSGLFKAECIIPGNLLNDGTLIINFGIVKDGARFLTLFEEILRINIFDDRLNFEGWTGKWGGYFRPILNFNLIKK
ncbi:lipopolysaccharide transport system ATP-binding protein [Kaistella chaponensis]|uniref:Lipopolysaccharide transport system ATP-binding protein n=1 Tax=Kaistella chaponensis TaxID=713588 RepID=A0A1N7ME21_9FLAO|nr:ABC transporter ATP-binding protein [Kaistella chaponensis]SIS84272.1 lipopolysaccharide transport system ATP-binding protein [Kaistella chaponensis]